MYIWSLVQCACNLPFCGRNGKQLPEIFFYPVCLAFLLGRDYTQISLDLA
jgi:hypothetical protein